MSDIFLKLLNMSINAGWLALAVIVLRPLLSRAPKYIRCILWAFVGIRLVCPFSVESVLSLIPSSQTVPPEIVYSNVPAIHSGISILNSAVNPIISEQLAPDPLSSAYSPIQAIIFIASAVWLAGMAVMLIYTAVSYIRIKLSVREAALLEENIYICDNIGTPFILGIIRPRIYLPSSMDKADAVHVIAHEKAHLERHDHIWKPLGFLLLTVYWFNPILWAAYILFCRDIELACDEKVISVKGNDIKKAYSNALINCSVPKRMLAACPLAFGETGVKSRIRSVLSYKKPAFWIVIISLILCVAVAVCFLTNPKDKRQSNNYGIVGTTSGAEYDDVVFELVSASINEDFPHIEIRWTNNTDKTLCYGEPYSLFKGNDELEVKGNMAWTLPAYMILPGGSAGHTFNLDYYDISENGRYRLESWFWFEEDNTKEKHRAYIQFAIDRQYSFVGRQYKGERVIFNDGMYSSIGFTNQNIPEFMITDDQLHLLTDDTLRVTSYSQWLDLGELERYTLTKPMWDEILNTALWETGYSAKVLRENNLNTMRVIDEHNNRLAFLLEQKNGEIYIAYGYADTYTIRWIFKMKEMDFDHVYGDLNEPSVSYSYNGSSDPLTPTLTLFSESGKFRFMFSSLSSYVPTGTYELTDTELILTTDELYSETYTFTRDGDRFIFDDSRSQTLPSYKSSDGKFESPVPDGAVFEQITAE